MKANIVKPNNMIEACGGNILLSYRKIMDIKISILYSSETFDHIVGQVLETYNTYDDICVNDYVCYVPNYNEHCFDTSIRLFCELYVNKNDIFKINCKSVSILPMLVPILVYSEYIFHKTCENCDNFFLQKVYPKYILFSSKKSVYDIRYVSDIVQYSIDHNIVIDIHCIYYLDALSLSNNGMHRFYPVIYYEDANDLIS